MIQYDDQNRLHGLWEEYYRDGQLFYQRTYHHGQLHGLCEGYFGDGILRFRGYFHMDEKIGYWKWASRKPEYYARM